MLAKPPNGSSREYSMKHRLLVLLLSTVFAAPVIAQDKPNILLIFMDNFGWGEPGFNGGGIVRGAQCPPTRTRF